jgi:lactoylglutathione lyase
MTQPARMIHSMIRVLDEARSVDFYRRAFGLEVVDRLAFDGFTLLYLRNGASPFELELTINEGRTERYQLGDGYGHVAVTVDDLNAEHARMEGAGVKPGPIRELSHEGAPLARFFFVQDPDGYRIEVLQRGGRYG